LLGRYRAWCTYYGENHPENSREIDANKKNQGEPDGSRRDGNPTLEELAFREVGAAVAVWLKYADGEWTEWGEV
jgi:hypothetical protein